MREFLMRRTRYFMKREVPDLEVSLLIGRMRLIFRVLPNCVGLAVSRAVANAWTSSRRMSHGATRCLWGCSAVGGDDLQRYVACPLLERFASHPRLHTPRWAGSGHMQIVFLLLPLGDSDTCVTAIWLYLAHLLYAGARRDTRTWDPDFFTKSTRVVVRSSIARLPAIRAYLVREAA